MNKKLLLKISLPIIFMLIGLTVMVFGILLLKGNLSDIKRQEQKSQIVSEKVVVNEVDSEDKKDASSKETTNTKKTDTNKEETKGDKKVSQKNNLKQTEKEEDEKNNSGFNEEIVNTFSLNNEFEVPNSQALYYHDDVSNITLPYRLFLPDGYDKKKEYPVLLFLHGAGEVGSDNSSHLNNFTQAFSVAGDILRKAIIVCPQCPSDSWWELDGYYYRDEAGALGTAKHLLDDVIYKYNGDTDRIYVTGLSMGGYGTWQMLQRYGNYFAAGVPLCGWGDPSQATKLAKIPIWVFHGTDDPTVNIEGSKEMVRAISEKGGTMLEYTELVGVGHNAWDYAYKNREMFCWMFSQDAQTHQSVLYDYFEYFKVTDPDGNVLITEEDIEFVSQSFSGEKRYIEATLTQEAAVRVKRAYKNNMGKIFTVYYCSEKLYTFKPLSAPESNSFPIYNVVDEKSFNKMVVNFERLNADS